MNIKNYIEKIPSEEYYYPLLSATAVLRKTDTLRNLLKEGGEKNFQVDKIYESLLQTYLFAGYPSALNSLQFFHEIFPNFVSNAESPEDVHSAGIENCRVIYGDKVEKLIENVKKFSPELSVWLINEGYGKVLSRGGLSLKERELNIVAILSALKYENQLYSHINGAYKTGSTVENISMVINILSLVDKGAQEFGTKVLSNWVKR
jgi:4-carboxymuconolactone decarboxylase